MSLEDFRAQPCTGRDEKLKKSTHMGIMFQQVVDFGICGNLACLLGQEEAWRRSELPAALMDEFP